ncbi:nuclease-like protein [Apiospora phragmitis]|uniref:Nuclease-like protein n=1 Tax=Apiospora phragmitis TaxID=2905665 RepID=A0ABR1UIL1_9PEZI
MPAINPLWYLYPADADTYGIDLQYFFGACILVSPVTDEDATDVSVYLPDDVFYELNTPGDAVVVRGRGAPARLRDVPFDRIPLHVRGGCVVPMRVESANTTELCKKGFELLVAPGLRRGDGGDGRGRGRGAAAAAAAVAEGELYVDDRVSLDGGANRLGLHFRYYHDDDGDGGSGMVEITEATERFVGAQRPDERRDGKPLRVLMEEAGMQLDRVVVLGTGTGAGQFRYLLSPPRPPSRTTFGLQSGASASTPNHLEATTRPTTATIAVYNCLVGRQPPGTGAELPQWPKCLPVSTFLERNWAASSNSIACDLPVTLTAHCAPAERVRRHKASLMAPSLSVLYDDGWINDRAQSADISQLKDNAVAVDASYYLQLFLDNIPFHEPLLPALGGLTGIESHIESDLESWDANKTTPFFIFNGQAVEGQDEVSLIAVAAFGTSRGAYPVQNLFPLLQSILKKHNLHFLVPPFNACAQLTYFDMIDSEQCSGIMGPQELLLYPIKDFIIRSIDWETGKFTALSKKNIIKSLNVTEPMFVDALLMRGTSFLPSFPPLEDTGITPHPPASVIDAVNMLRTADKSIATACASFGDILQKKDPNWLKKYHKARMTIDHFIYITEAGEPKVHNFDTLTKDNYEYLGYQLPAELFHYLNAGLIGARVPSWVTHGQIIVAPTLDGVPSPEYKKLVTTQLMPLREQTLGLIMPRLNRGIQFKPVNVKTWFDEKYSHAIDYRSGGNKAIEQANTWSVKEETVKQHFPNAKHGSILFEVSALKNAEFAKATISKEKIKGIDSDDMVASMVIWRFLHLRGYVNDNHQLTNPEDKLADAVLLAYELIRLDLLHTRNQHPELNGLPMNGSDQDKASLLLISRCAILLKLYHEANGYTGPLSKNFLHFRSLSSSIREANRDLVEAIVTSLLLHGQGKKERDDYLTMGQRLPFLMDTDVALGIAIKTLLDDIQPSDTPEVKASKRADFPGKFVPYATDLHKDLKIADAFFVALNEGIKTSATSKSPPTIARCGNMPWPISPPEDSVTGW